jgi:hypothetical protein
MTHKQKGHSMNKSGYIYGPNFAKRLDKCTLEQASIFGKKLDLLLHNEGHPSLNVKKVFRANKLIKKFDVNKSLRTAFHKMPDKNIFILLHIGKHDDIYKRYTKKLEDIRNEINTAIKNSKPVALGYGGIPQNVDSPIMVLTVNDVIRDLIHVGVLENDFV